MKILTVKQSDGSIWGVPVELIAMSRAEHYAHEFGNDVQRSLKEDTLPLFDGNGGESEVLDWAENNMNWPDVADKALLIKMPGSPDFQEAWVNGDKNFIEVDMG